MSQNCVPKLCPKEFHKVVLLKTLTPISKTSVYIGFVIVYHPRVIYDNLHKFSVYDSLTNPLPSYKHD